MKNPEKSQKIIQDNYTRKGALSDDVVRQVYDNLTQTLEPTLYPTLEAISNVYQLGVRQDADAAKISPLALWDMHPLREIDDAGFIKDLYK